MAILTKGALLELLSNFPDDMPILINDSQGEEDGNLLCVIDNAFESTVSDINVSSSQNVGLDWVFEDLPTGSPYICLYVA